ncbi:hypothetical protein GCM10011371_13070 [Novosphingobium marinum]|uniref:Uncharacterized protein n=1 Tax=Novosphingobium marinum TaxID=1514948 RepID=A0A7Y9XXY6_9SPHN|nr:hypothetical protein [Novosphingobium marinum]NYH95415.1 hypothetical protein [Novosphingobium marinum]GGC26871.1 hypothetical protein GCM10011371_13070 [Novosphingobium marinum]
MAYESLRIRTEREAPQPGRFANFQDRVYGSAPTRKATDARTPAAPRQAAKNATTGPANRYTGADLAMTRYSAEAAATKAERERFAKVFASPHSRGRERGCVSLLTSAKGWTAAAIIAELPHLPTDAEIARNDPAAKARAAAVWDRAYATDATNAKAADKAPADVWSRAYEGARA